MYYRYLDTPIGELLLAGDDDALSLVGFPEGSMRREPEPDWIYSEKPFGVAREQLTDYFEGKRTTFDLNLRPSGTEFQRMVRFPSTDLGLLKALGSMESDGRRATPAELLHHAEAWRPWRAYAALLLWGSLANSGG